MNLYVPGELEQLQHDLPHLIHIQSWVENFLGKPHPKLGRSGAVCPFVPRALQLQTVHFSVIRTRGINAQQLEDIVRGYRDSFLEIEPSQGELAFYKAILLIFPDVTTEEAPQLIDEVQRKLKPFFVEEGLMIGEFHALNESPGLHNPDFRPLRSPVPMLAIRFMAESDLPFLERETDAPEVRIRYLEAYLKRWSSVIKNEKKLEAARKSLASAYAQLNLTPPEGMISANHNYEASAPASKCPFAGVLKMARWVKQKITTVEIA